MLLTTLRTLRTPWLRPIADVPHPACWLAPLRREMKDKGCKSYQACCTEACSALLPLAATVSMISHIACCVCYSGEALPDWQCQGSIRWVSGMLAHGVSQPAVPVSSAARAAVPRPTPCPAGDGTACVLPPSPVPPPVPLPRRGGDRRGCQRSTQERDTPNPKGSNRKGAGARQGGRGRWRGRPVRGCSAQPSSGWMGGSTNS